MTNKIINTKLLDVKKFRSYQTLNKVLRDCLNAKDANTAFLFYSKFMYGLLKNVNGISKDDKQYILSNIKHKIVEKFPDCNLFVKI